MIEPPLNSQHVTLNIQPPQIKMTKPLQYLLQKHVHSSVKEYSRSLHKLSLLNLDKSQHSFLIQKAVANLKQTKFLSHLDIEIGSFPSTHGLQRLVESFKHLKNLSVLHFHVVSFSNASYTISLCQSLKRLFHDLPKMQVKLTLSAADGDRHCGRLLQRFTKVRNFTSARLNFSKYLDSSKIEESIAIFKESKSLSDLSVTLSSCTIYPSIRLQNLFASLKFIKSLKNSRVYLKNCVSITNYGLQKILPLLKGLNNHLQNLEIVFENCGNSITRLEWWLFISSIRRLRTSCKISANFIGAKKGNSALLMIFLSMLCVMLFFFIIIGIPAIIGPPPVK